MLPRQLLTQLQHAPLISTTAELNSTVRQRYSHIPRACADSSDSALGGEQNGATAHPLALPPCVFHRRPVSRPTLSGHRGGARPIGIRMPPVPSLGQIYHRATCLCFAVLLVLPQLLWMCCGPPLECAHQRASSQRAGGRNGAGGMLTVRPWSAWSVRRSAWPFCARVSVQ